MGREAPPLPAGRPGRSVPAGRLCTGLWMVFLGARLGRPRPCEQQIRQWTFPPWPPRCFAHVSCITHASCLRRVRGLTQAFCCQNRSYCYYYVTTQYRHTARSLPPVARTGLPFFCSLPPPAPLLGPLLTGHVRLSPCRSSSLGPDDPTSCPRLTFLFCKGARRMAQRPDGPSPALSPAASTLTCIPVHAVGVFASGRFPVFTLCSSRQDPPFSSSVQEKQSLISIKQERSQAFFPSGALCTQGLAFIL